MTGPLGDIWVYLSATPLLWLTATLVAYLIGVLFFDRLRRNPMVQPVAVAVVLLVAVLMISDTAYESYFDGAQFVHFLLGPATVALAVPLYAQWSRVKRSVLPMAAALAAGSLTAVTSAIGIAFLLGASRESVMSLAPKSVTTPIAMGIAEKIGGLPSLTAVLVILTGIIGAMTATPLLNLMGLKDYAARGFAVGLAAHGIGTARAFQVSELAGAFAGIAMGLNALATALIVPLVIRLIG